MKIAQVAPLWESVPPKLYGGTERVVSYLTEELVNQGHEVTLFASGDSVTRANLVPVTERALRLDRGHVIDPIAHHVRMLEMVFQQAHEFDVVHFHTDYLHFPLVKRLPLTTLTTLHGRLDIPDLIPLFPAVLRRERHLRFRCPTQTCALGKLARDGVPRIARRTI